MQYWICCEFIYKPKNSVQLCMFKYSMHSSTSKLLAKEMSALGIAAFHCVSVSMCETERDNEADRHREGD